MLKKCNVTVHRETKFDVFLTLAQFDLPKPVERFWEVKGTCQRSVVLCGNASTLQSNFLYTVSSPLKYWQTKGFGGSVNSLAIWPRIKLWPRIRLIEWLNNEFYLFVCFLRYDDAKLVYEELLKEDASNAVSKNTSPVFIPVTLLLYCSCTLVNRLFWLLTQMCTQGHFWLVFTVILTTMKIQDDDFYQSKTADSF